MLDINVRRTNTSVILPLTSLSFSFSENDCSVISEVQWEKHSLTYFHIVLVRRHALLLHNYEQDLYGATNENTNTHKAAIIALRRKSATRLYTETQMYAGL